MPSISSCGRSRRKQDETMNMEDHVWIKKGTKMYLKRETGDVKVE